MEPNFLAMEEGLLEEEELIVLCKMPVLLKDGGELTTDQQQSIMKQFQVKCTTRPLRHGRAGVHITWAWSQTHSSSVRAFRPS